MEGFMRTIGLLLLGAGCTGTGDTTDDSSDTETPGLIDAATGGTVTSDDGVLAVTIPPDALAEDTVITVAVVAEGDWPSEVAATAPLGPVYEIGPDGTEFSEPVTLTWSFATPPSGTTVSGRPILLWALGRDAAGTIAPHEQTADQLDDSGGLVVTSDVSHFSMHWFTGGPFSTSITATAAAELGGGRHAEHEVWPALLVGVTVTSDVEHTRISANTYGEETVKEVVSATWIDASEPGIEGGTLYDERDVALAAHVTWGPSELPEYKCVAAGLGHAVLALSVEVPVGAGSASASTRFSEEVTCVAREEKAAYKADAAELGEERIEELGVPGSDSVDLSTTSGEYGYRVVMPPSSSIESCVTANGAVGVLYDPQYSPGYDFVDTTPGCTTVTSRDDEFTNAVLIILSGTAQASITTVTH